LNKRPGTRFLSSSSGFPGNRLRFRAEKTDLRATPRFFSFTPARYGTQAILNPQVDDDGKEMILEITPRAAKVRIPPFLLFALSRTSIDNMLAPHGDYEERQ
jgi:hypothetical protein